MVNRRHSPAAGTPTIQAPAECR